MQQSQTTRPMHRNLKRMPQQHPSSPKQKQDTAKSRNKSWWILGGVVAVIVLAMFCLLSVLGAVVLINGNKIADGVSVAGVNVGGLRADAAKAELAAKLSDRQVVLRDGDRQWQSSFKALGMNLNLEATVEATKLAKSGQTVTPRYQLDLNQTQRGLVVHSDEVNIPAIPGA